MISKKSKIWDDKTKYYNSMYDESYQPPVNDGNGLAKDHIQKQLTQLRSSNILMGTDPNQYKSIFMEDYVSSESLQERKQGLSYNKAKPSYDLKATHYKIGNDKPEYNSTHKSEFGWKDPVINNAQVQALTKDLRAHHFDFGTDPLSFTSEHAAKYLDRKPDVNNVAKNDPYKNNFKVGQAGLSQPNHYLSVYNESHTEKKMDPNLQSRDKGKDTSSTVQLGYGPQAFDGLSEFKDK